MSSYLGCRIGPVFAVYFRPGDGRIEDAGHDKLFFGAQDVPVMFVQRIHDAGGDLVGLAGGEIELVIAM